MNYRIEDFKKVARGTATAEEMSEFYCVSKEAFINAMKRRGYKAGEKANGRKKFIR